MCYDLVEILIRIGTILPSPFEAALGAYLISYDLRELSDTIVFKNLVIL